VAVVPLSIRSGEFAALVGFVETRRVGGGVSGTRDDDHEGEMSAGIETALPSEGERERGGAKEKSRSLSDINAGIDSDESSETGEADGVSRSLSPWISNGFTLNNECRDAWGACVCDAGWNGITPCSPGT